MATANDHKSGYEIRQLILSEARQHLMEQFYHRVNIEEAHATFHQRAPKLTPPVDPDDVLKLAEKFYAFVQKRD